MSSGVAIVGMACCYADARNPQELWENVLAQRRAFRRMPPERLRLRDYFSSDPQAPDALYAAQAALIGNYEFDRVRFRVAGPIFRSVDLAHWLALDVAGLALEDAGFLAGGGHSLPQESTGVLVGNTLTGEFSRAATLRLRWPFVRRVVEARLQAEGWDEPRRSGFLRDLERDYKEPFAPVGEETLAGALSNTIAGRICNYFHLGGGGYTLDGACCSSLLAVARACSALEAREIDLALAGGVDLSLDPFELVGFAKAGALARGEMLVYDRESSGFLPGEGSGFVVLVRAEDAHAQGLRSYGVIRGWGISSDGGGSITRPEIQGQALALMRAYERAGYGPETVTLFEGHGTGTPVGDQVELQALTSVRMSLCKATPAAVIGSIKANIGHTKAAAGIAGLIKTALAIHHRTIPPVTGTRRPRPELEGETAGLKVIQAAEPWPDSQPLRAGVNSFGFGGINVHVTLEGDERNPVPRSWSREQMLDSSAQDAELFLFTADSRAELVGKLQSLIERAPDLSYAELADASTALACRLSAQLWRAAVVTSSPARLEEQLRILLDLLKHGAASHISPDQGIFMGTARNKPRILFLFPGQASPVRLDGSAHARRFSTVRELYRAADLSPESDVASTEIAQIAIATAEVTGLRMMRELGIEASIAVGHSLGELTAYYWAGAMEEGSLLSLVRARGRCMAGIPGPAGAMATLGASASEVEALLAEHIYKGCNPPAIACFNGHRQVVVAGEGASVALAVAQAQNRGWSAQLLPTANAFHSPLMEAAVEPFQKAVKDLDRLPFQRCVVSTVRGAELPANADWHGLLVEQLTKPVRFVEALLDAAKDVDLLVEVGPGAILTHLADGLSETPALSLDVGGPSLTGILQVAAAAHVLGAPLRLESLFHDRFSRPFDFNRRPSFFVNPCELAPTPAIAEDPRAAAAWVPQNGHAKIGATADACPASAPAAGNPLEIVRTLISRRTELPPEAISEAAHLLRDLHLNSIVVGELVATAARHLDMTPPRHVLEFSDATVGQIAKALERLRAAAEDTPAEIQTSHPGVDEWQRAFFVDWMPCPLRRPVGSLQPPGVWTVFGAGYPELAGGLARLPGSGVIVGLAEESPAGGAAEQHAAILLQAAHAVLKTTGRRRYFVVIGAAAAAAAFARTVHFEDPNILTRVIDAPLDSHGVARITDEVSTVDECVEARYDDNGIRAQACLRLLEKRKEAKEPIPLGPKDVVLVTGGGKGIVAECSLMLARESGAALAILGRSHPEDDQELALHLKKLDAHAVRARYICADVTDEQAVKSAARDAEASLGRVTAIVHGAGVNSPRLLRDLDQATLRRTLAPKIQGLRNLLAVVDVNSLHLLVTFGSVIGRVGLHGEADYALANAYQSLLTEEFAREHPACRCLAFESSAWSGIGMAKRLGSVDSLRRGGITLLQPEHGVDGLRDLLSHGSPSVSMVLAGRLGAQPPLPMEGRLPLLRFLEKPRVYYPGVELVADSEVSTASDPYLLDHVFEGQPLMPGVIALEAMTQAAMAVTGETRLPVLTDVRFDRPLTIAAGARVTLRVAALVREPGCVEVVLRSSTSLFQADHVRCVCCFGEPPHLATEMLPPSNLSRMAINPEEDLYGKLLFQSGRFRRLAGYRSLNARSCLAEIAPATSADRSNRPGASPITWFSDYLPPVLMLGDAGARDATLHSVQACVPHVVLLPVGVKRFYVAQVYGNEEPLDQQLFVHARRRWVDGNTYCYDVELRTANGILRERWEELQLRKVADVKQRMWPDPLVAAFLEWRVHESMPASNVAAAFDRDRSADRRSRSKRAIQKALESPQALDWRADGKPEVRDVAVSAAHSDGLTLAVAGPGPVACDLEPVRDRSEQVWRDLLGGERWRLAKLIAGESGEDVHTSATRVWTALESLKKAAAPDDATLVLLSCAREKQGCVALAASGLRISSSIVQFREDPAKFAVSILAGATVSG
jgi:enediyne polyketide synthase